MAVWILLAPSHRETSLLNSVSKIGIWLVGTAGNQPEIMLETTC